MKFFKCVQCGVVTKSRKKMEVHHINNHVTPDCVPLLCMFCGFRSMDSNRMRNHPTFFKSHGDKPVEIIFSKTPFKLYARDFLLLERLPLVKNFTFTPEEAFQPDYNDDLEEEDVLLNTCYWCRGRIYVRCRGRTNGRCCGRDGDRRREYSPERTGYSMGWRNSREWFRKTSQQTYILIDHLFHLLLSTPTVSSLKITDASRSNALWWNLNILNFLSVK